MPTIEETLQEMSGAKVFSKLDLNMAACLSQDLEPPPMAKDPLCVYPLGFGTNFLIL